MLGRGAIEGTCREIVGIGLAQRERRRPQRFLPCTQICPKAHHHVLHSVPLSLIRKFSAHRPATLLG